LFVLFRPTWDNHCVGGALCPAKPQGRQMQKLVKGYVADKKIDGEGYTTQRHYAVFEDGTVKQTKSHFRAINPNFNRHFAWEPVAALPAGAEFIGHYPANM
jgi:hypothetical protein